MGVVNKRGQVIMPKKIRDKLGWHRGDDLDFVVRDDQIHVVKRQAATPDKRGAKSQ